MRFVPFEVYEGWIRKCDIIQNWLSVHNGVDSPGLGPIVERSMHPAMQSPALSKGRNLGRKSVCTKWVAQTLDSSAKQNNKNASYRKRISYLFYKKSETGYLIPFKIVMSVVEINKSRLRVCDDQR